MAKRRHEREEREEEEEETEDDAEEETSDDDGDTADEDAVLMKTIFDLPEPYPVMSPVHIPRGFTKAYIAGEVVEDLGARIRAAHAAFAGRDILVIEGTGHAGVGAVIGLSNAVVAQMLGAPAVIVSEGGVGRPIDEIVLNASHFTSHGVEVAGAIVNKVRVDEQPGIEETLRRGQELGLVRAGDVRVMGACVIGAVKEVLNQYITGLRTRTELTEFPHELLLTLLTGIAVEELRTQTKAA